MKTLDTKPHKYVSRLSCDRCGRAADRGDGEFEEFLSTAQACGSSSVFRDGMTRELDLCQHCVREVLGQWIRTTPGPLLSKLERYEPEPGGGG